MPVKPSKPKIEEVVSNTYDGKALDIALDFIGFLRENKVSLTNKSPQSWQANFKSKIVAIVILQEKGLCLSLRGDFYSKSYESIITNEKTAQSLRDNLYLKPCNGCNSKCSDGVTAHLFGMEYSKVCKHMPNTTYFNIADDHASECAKLIIRKRCDDILAV